MKAAPNVPVRNDAARRPALFFGISLGSRLIMRPAPKIVGNMHMNVCQYSYKKVYIPGLSLLTASSVCCIFCDEPIQSPQQACPAVLQYELRITRRWTSS